MSDLCTCMGMMNALNQMATQMATTIANFNGNVGVGGESFSHADGFA